MSHAASRSHVSAAVRAALLALVLGAPAGAEEAMPCAALSARDFASLGWPAGNPPSPSAWQNHVSLASPVALAGREVDCLWSFPGASALLTYGRIDTAAAKSELPRLARKLFDAVQAESARTIGDRAYTIAPLAGAGEGAFYGTLQDLGVRLVGYSGANIVRLDLSGQMQRRMPTHEEAVTLLRRALANAERLAAAEPAPVADADEGAAEVSPYLVTGSVMASGDLAGMFLWQEPNAVSFPAGAVLEVTLNTVDKTAFCNLKVDRAGKVRLLSGKLGGITLTGAGGAIDALLGEDEGTVRVDATVQGGGKTVTLHGVLKVKPNPAARR